MLTWALQHAGQHAIGLASAIRPLDLKAANARWTADGIDMRYGAMLALFRLEMLVWKV